MALFGGASSPISKLAINLWQSGSQNGPLRKLHLKMVHRRRSRHLIECVGPGIDGGTREHGCGDNVQRRRQGGAAHSKAGFASIIIPRGLLKSDGIWLRSREFGAGGSARDSSTVSLVAGAAVARRRRSGPPGKHHPRGRRGHPAPDEEPASDSNACNLCLREKPSGGPVSCAEILTADDRNGFTRETVGRNMQPIRARSCRQAFGPGSRFFGELKLPAAPASAGTIDGIDGIDGSVIRVPPMCRLWCGEPASSLTAAHSLHSREPLIFALWLRLDDMHCACGLRGTPVGDR
jgi:hypothetical protein